MNQFEEVSGPDTADERETERERLLEERSRENFITRKIREIKERAKMAISSEGYIGAGDMALFSAAGYSKEEIDWIATVKNFSSEKKPGSLNAYDLVRVHAMLARDLKKLGSDIISDQTEEYLDEILLSIAMQYEYIGKRIEEVGLEKLTLNSPYEAQAVTYFSQYKKAKTARGKVVVLTMWLNLVHSGGNREVLSMFGGFPVPNNPRDYKEVQSYQQDFLSRLNNLGSV